MPIDNKRKNCKWISKSLNKTINTNNMAFMSTTHAVVCLCE